MTGGAAVTVTRECNASVSIPYSRTHAPFDRLGILTEPLPEHVLEPLRSRFDGLGRAVHMLPRHREKPTRDVRLDPVLAPASIRQRSLDEDSEPVTTRRALG